MKKQFDWDTFLNQTFFGLDTQAMLGDVEHFLDFSERNIDWQKRREFRKTEQECNEEAFDDAQTEAQYRSQMLEGVVHRFDVILSQRVRYAALTSLITTIEWVLISLKTRVTFPIPIKSDGKNEAVHILEVFDEEASLGLTNEIDQIETLAQVRNCIVHAAGLLGSYKYANGLRQRLSTNPGIDIANINYLGDAIEIKRGYLQDVIEKINRWLPNIEKEFYEKSLLRK